MIHTFQHTHYVMFKDEHFNIRAFMSQPDESGILYLTIVAEKPDMPKIADNLDSIEGLQAIAVHCESNNYGYIKFQIRGGAKEPLKQLIMQIPSIIKPLKPIP